MSPCTLQVEFPTFLRSVELMVLPDILLLEMPRLKKKIIHQFGMAVKSGGVRGRESRFKSLFYYVTCFV